MTVVPDGFWKGLELSKPTGDEWRVRGIKPELSNRLVGGINSAGNRALLIALQSNEESLDDSRSRGLSVRTIVLAEGTQRSGRYLVIECLDSNGYALFDLIAADLSNVLINSNPAIAVTRVLGKWRRFWGQPPRNVLSREAILGLFAELWFLRYWMIPAVGPDKAMKRWRGPMGARRDFEWTEHAVEVKASTIVNRPAFRISSIDQLDAGSETLWLFGLRLREDASSNLNLPDLIGSCVVALENDPDSLMLLESMLSSSGYSRIFESEYRQLSLRIVNSTLYQVTNTFPKLIPSMITGGLPQSISEVRYTVDVSAFSGPSFERPEQASHLFQ